MKPSFYFILSIYLLLAGTANAQFGLRVGGNFSGFITSTNNGYRTSTDDKLSYQFGIFYKQQLTQRLSFTPELQYSNEQMTITRSFVSDATFHAVYASNFTYVNVPLLLRATWGRAYVEVGPQAGMLVGGHETGTVNVNQTTLHIDHDATDPTIGYRRFDVGPSLGAGFLLSKSVGLNVRAYQGVVSLTHDSKANIAHLYRQSLQVSLVFQVQKE